MKNENLGKVLKIYFLLFGVIVFINGCGSTKEVTEIKSRIIHPEAIEDTIYIVEKADTVIVGVNMNKTDTVTVVKYFPKEQKFYLKAKPDSIIIMDTVKTYQVIEKITETPLLAKAGLVFIGLIAGMFFLLFLRK